ncbi:MAG: flagellar protein FlgN [Desulfohalobiaceae bacterium]
MRRIAENLIRQHKGLKLLAELLQEEYALLKGKDQENLAALEFSVQELVRQLAAEKDSLQLLLQSMQPPRNDLRQLAGSLSGKQAGFVQESSRQIRSWEERCREQARINADLSLALLEQSRELMDFLQQEVRRDTPEVYSSSGSWSKPAAREPSVLKGRL